MKKIRNLFNKLSISFIFSFFSILFLLVSIIFVFFSANKNSSSNYIYVLIFIFISLSIIFVIIYTFSLKYEILKKNKIINNNINFYFENLTSNFSIGLIMFHPNGKIIWSSNFVKERFGNIIKKNITFFDETIDLNKKLHDFHKIFKNEEFVYKISFFSNQMMAVIQDITQEYSATHFYEIEKPVIGEVEIDNYQLISSSLSDEELFNVQKTIKDIFDELSKKYNFIYKQYMDSKFTLFTNRENLNKMIINEFKEFNKLSNTKIDKFKISLSIGFGADSPIFSKLMDMAKEALYQSQTRGGDQISIISSIEKIKRFGSKFEITPLKSRTKIKNVANNLKIKLQDSKIKNVIIYGHKFADLDALGASYALYEICNSYGKKTIIQNQTFDNTAKKAIKKYLNNNENIFSSDIKIKNYDKNETLVIIVDCAENTRVENIDVFKNVIGENLFIFDHHRVSELDIVIQNYNIYIESTASSACEIVTEIIWFNEFNNYLSKKGAQMLLNGIYLDTNQFKKAVTSRTFAAASMLEDWGANIEESISIMKISSEVNEIIIKMLSRSKEIKPGYWLSYIDEIIPIDIISMCADEILKIDGRKASFVIAQIPKKNPSDNPTYKLSARSIGINVQLIAETVGGGGHFNAAAAESDFANNESLQTFVDNVIQAIISSK